MAVSPIRSALVLLGCLLSAFACATHIVGGEVYYRCLGGSNYQITMKVYRDCYNGVPPLDNPGVLYIYTGNGVLYDSIWASPVITILPVIINTPCLGAPPTVCVEEGIYTYYATLPPSPLGYHLTYQRCCRNNTIVNLVSPGSQGSTYWQTVPSSSVVTCNSSPYFKNFPPIAICLGEQLVFDHSAIDLDGDSLVYELFQPFQGGSTGIPLPQPAAPPPYATVVYSGGYSYTYPIASSPAFAINPSTGLLTGTPTQVGQYVVGVNVKEYRNGVFIENHYRDFQFNVVQCEPTVVASTPDLSSCNTLTMNFTNTSVGAATYWWNFGDPNSSADTSLLPNPVYTYPTVDKYTVTLIVTDGGQCSDTTTAVVNLFDPWTLADFSNTAPCVGGAMQFNDLSAVDTGWITNWMWSFGDGGISFLKDPSHVYAGAGPYIVTLQMTTNLGCTTTVTKPVYLSPKPVADFTFSAMCSSVPVPFTDLSTISSGTISNWQWYFGDGGTSTLQNPTHLYAFGGTFNVTLIVTSAAGCSTVITKPVTIYPSPLANAGPDKSFCAGGAATLNGSGGITFSWSPATGLSSTGVPNPTAAPTSTTVYTLTVANVYGCTDDDAVLVTVHPLPVANAGPDQTTCTGTGAPLSASGGGSYLWSPSTFLTNPNIPNPTANNPATMAYTVTVTDANGCTDTDDLTITVLPVPTADAGPDVAVCNGQTAQLSGTGGITYSWMPATGLSSSTIPDPAVTITSTTTYTLTVTDINGCTDDDDVIVGVLPSPSASAGPDHTYCAGDSAQLLGTGGITFSWSPPTSLNAANIQNPVSTTALDMTYTLTVTNAYGCSDSDLVAVTVHPLPVANAGPDQAMCAGNSAQLNGSGGMSYLWSPATGLSSAAIPNPVATPAVTTIYMLTVTDANGCTDDDAVQVIINPQPVANAGPDVGFCQGGSVQLSGSGGTLCSWSPAAGLNDPTIWNPVAQPISTTTYQFSIVDANGCADTDYVVVSVLTLPVASAGPDVMICSGTSAQLNATGGVSYAWNPPTGLSNPNIANPIVTPNDTTIYTVTVTDVNGCQDTDDLVVTALPLPAADAGPPGEICPGASVQLDGSGVGSFSWSPTIWLSDPSTPDPVSTPDQTITYQLTVTDANGCEGTDQTQVTVWPEAQADAGPDTTIFPGASVELKGSGNGSFTWSPAATLSNPYIARPIATPPVTTRYLLEVETPHGCYRSDSVVIYVLEPYGIEIPTAFSPNGDGVNHVFLPLKVMNFTMERFVIFNRWGQMVFESFDINHGWDGTVNGIEQDIASFAFIVYGHGNRGEPVQLQGNVTLIR